ncbi:MAG: ACT domain-containing protein, partial [Candidatus Acidiferrales bacterium]
YRLQNGDIVEILTQAAHTPSRDWLNLVRTSKARNKIRHWIHAHERQQAVELGQRLLEREAQRHQLKLKKVTPEDWARVVQEHGCQKVEELYARIGFGKFAPRQVLARLSPEPLPEQQPAASTEISRLARLRRTVARVFRLTEKGLPLRDTDLLIYRARCCNPVRGEAIVGYITRGRGISVHAKECPNVENLLYDSERRVSVDWAEGAEEAYPVRLAIPISDRPGLLTEISGVIAKHDCNIRSAEAHTDASHGTGVIELVFEVKEKKQLNRILTALKKVKGVRGINRLLRL